MCKRIANRTKEKEGRRERVTDSNAESRSGKQISGCVSKPTDKLDSIFGHHSLSSVLGLIIAYKCNKIFFFWGGVLCIPVKMTVYRHFWAS